MSTGKRTAVFSIATASHVPRAQVLFESLRRQQPDWDRHLCLVDRINGRFDPDAVGAELTLAETLGLPGGPGFFRRYSAFEACCAVKPSMAKRLFAQGYEQVVYLDADIEVYRPLAEVDEALRTGMLVLTPHRLGPCADLDQERMLLRAGAYNAGFFALASHPQTPAFLRWWERSLATDCLNAQDRGSFVDQRWLDQAPAAFQAVHLLRHPGYNVGHWNLAERPLRSESGGLSAAGQPLVFFHYSAFDPASGALSAHAPALRLADSGLLAGLAAGYAGRLARAGAAQAEGWNCLLKVGDAWPAFKRRWPPYRQWLEREDLQRHFPDPDGADRRAFLQWSLRHGLDEHLRQQLGRVPGLRRAYHRALSLALRARTLLMPRPTFEPGVDLVGYLRAENGVGEACRLAADALQAEGVPFSILDVSQHSPTPNAIADWQPRFVHAARRKAALIHVNSSVMPHLVRMARGRGLFRGQRHIGVWHWELPVLPREHASGFGFVDELWAPSRFIQAALRAAAPAGMPVLHLPHAVVTVPDPSLQRRDFGLPQDAYVFSSFFDPRSILQRKNPLGAIRAFQRAFRPADAGVFLQVKSNQGGAPSEALQGLRDAARGWPNIRVWDATLSRAANHRLIQLSDAVLSLHRSEGFGLVMAEAMAMGRVAVATGWSGNMDFMDEGNSGVVGYELRKIGADYGPYQAWQTWAEPDEAHAASIMRRLVEEPAWAKALAAKGQADLLALCSAEAAGRRMRERLLQLGAL